MGSTSASKLDAALVLGRFLKEKAKQLQLVVHRDADYMSADTARRFEKKLGAADIVPFITESSDIEGYFLNAEHLAHLNAGVAVERIQEIIDEATTAAAVESIAAIVNLRTEQAFRDRRESGVNPNHGAISVEAHSEYNANPATMRRGKVVIGRVAAAIQQETKANARIFLPSPYLVSERLKTVAQRIWPTVSNLSQPSPPS